MVGCDGSARERIVTEDRGRRILLVEVHAIRNVIVFQTQDLIIESCASSVLAEPVRDHERGAPRAVI
jgi:hypothetical protein